MKLYELIFSPTGGTRYAASQLAIAWEEGQVIDLCERGRDFSDCCFGPEDLCLAAVPVYGGRVPAAAAERLGAMHAQGTPAILLAVYGNRAYDDALLELQEILTARGFVCAAAVAAIAEHSILQQFATGRPDLSDSDQLKAFSWHIRDFLSGFSAEKTLSLPGSRPYRPYQGVPLKPETERKKCTRCGKCAQKCPVGAIPEEDPRTTDKSRCISCMRCLDLCPAGARKLNPLMLAAAGMGLKKACAERKNNEIFLAR